MSINVTVTETPNVDLTVATATGINLDVNNPTHNSLDGIQGGQQGEYYHLTASQYASLDQPNITTATIVDALGYTPLSTETDDQTLDEVLAQGNTSTRDISVYEITGSNLSLGNGVTDASIFLDGESGGGDLTLQNGGNNQDIFFKVNDGGVTTTALTIQGSTSNVGVNTSSPSSTLQVVGHTISINTTGIAGKGLHIGDSYNSLGIFGSSDVGTHYNPESLTFSAGNRNPSNSAYIDVYSKFGGVTGSFGNIDLHAGYFPASSMEGDISLYTNGQKTLVAKYDGKVGIGTTSPSYKLHVNGDTYAQSVSLDAENGGGIYNSTYSDVNILPKSNAFEFNVRTSSNVGKLRVSTNGSLYLASNANAINLGWLYNNIYPKRQLQLSFSGSGYTAFFDRDGINELMRVDGATGNVGIGTSSPISSLDVNGTISLNGETENKLYKSSTSPANGVATNTTVLQGRQIDLYALDDIVLRTGTSADDDIIFFAGNSEKARIKGNGNVGIGTTSPRSGLDIGDSDLYIGNHPTTRKIYFGGTANYFTRGAIHTTQTNLGLYNDYATGYITLNTNSGEAVRVDEDGNVGIGTTSPSYKLHIKENGYGFKLEGLTDGKYIRMRGDGSDAYIDAQGQNYLVLNNSGNGVKITSGSALTRLAIGAGSEAIYRQGNTLKLRTNSADRLFIDSSGNVGIGTTSPSAKLEVNGDVKINTIAAGTTDTDKFLISDGGIIKYRTGSQVLSDIGGLSTSSASSTYLPLAGGTLTGNVTFPSPDAINFVADSDTGESHGITARRTWKKSVSAGNLQKLGKWTDTEGTVQMLITVGSETGGNSGTSTYLWGGGYNSFAVGYRRLRPLTDHNGHGNGADNGTNDSWHVYLKQESSFVYSLSVAVPTGANNKNLRVTCVELAGGNNFTDMSSDSALAMSGLTISNSDQFSLNNITASSVTATSLIKSGGTSSQFLKANGSVDSNTYLTTSSASSTYLPLSGGTLSGNLSVSGSVGVTNIVTNRIVKFNGSILDDSVMYDDGTNIGIGTTSPNAKLQINGNVKIGNTSTGVRFYIQGIDEFRADALDVSGNGWNSLHLRADGTNGLFLEKDTNNVGIGTTSPTQTLHVEGSIFIKNNSFIRSKDGGATVYDLLGVTSGGIVQVGQPNRGLKFRGGGVSSDIDFELAGSTQFILKGNTGNVGIGTTSPASKLDINIALANSNGITLDTNDEVYSIWSNSNLGGLAINADTVGATSRYDLFIKSNGNVGIGTNSPSAKLEVNGHFAATTKSFIIDNPEKGGRLQYGVVETDEHSVYVRGKSDQEVVELPEEWDWLVHEDSVTVQLTSVGQMQQLFVMEQNNKRIKVSGLAPNGQYNYVVYGTRKDVDALEKHLK